MSYRCGTCKHFGLCAPDCPLGPWNLDAAKYPASPFAFLLRQRRWAGSPVDRRDTFFMDYEVRREQQLRFFGVGGTL